MPRHRYLKKKNTQKKPTQKKTTQKKPQKKTTQKKTKKAKGPMNWIRSKFTRRQPTMTNEALMQENKKLDRKINIYISEKTFAEANYRSANYILGEYKKALEKYAPELKEHREIKKIINLEERAAEEKEAAAVRLATLKENYEKKYESEASASNSSFGEEEQKTSN